MGFGWLTLGYFFVATVSMTELSLRSPLAIGILAGYPMMIFGLYLLAHYHRYFRVAFFTSVPTLLLAVYYALQALAQFGLSVPLIETSAETVGWLHFAWHSLLTLLFLLGIADLCRELSLMRHRINAWRNVLLFGFTTLLDFISRLPLGFINSHQGYFTTPALLMRLAIVFLNLHLLFSCFRDICSADEGIVESERRRKEKENDKAK